MILLDSSAWISFFRGDDHSQRVSALLASPEPLACTEPVQMEVVAGARSAAQAQTLRDAVRSREWLAFDAISDFDSAAWIYSAARAAGITPGEHVDCMIIAVALRNNATLLTLDEHQHRVAELVGVTSVL